jgi:ABC-2 type transport system permease protein
MLYCFIVVFAVVIISGVQLSLLALLCLPVVMAVQYIMALGMCFLVSAATVYFRDLQHIMGILVMAWQFLTPIIYPIELVQDNAPQLMPVFMANPMTPVIIAYRDILYYGRVPELFTLLHAFVFGIIILIIGIAVFGKLKRRFAEVL